MIVIVILVFVVEAGWSVRRTSSGQVTREISEVVMVLILIILVIIMTMAMIVLIIILLVKMMMLRRLREWSWSVCLYDACRTTRSAAVVAIVVLTSATSPLILSPFLPDDNIDMVPIRCKTGPMTDNSDKAAMARGVTRKQRVTAVGGDFYRNVSRKWSHFCAQILWVCVNGWSFTIDHFNDSTDEK